jgi:hypothetical protein
LLESVHRCLQVECIEEDDDVEHQSDGNNLVSLALFAPLSPLASIPAGFATEF